MFRNTIINIVTCFTAVLFPLLIHAQTNVNPQNDHRGISAENIHKPISKRLSDTLKDATNKGLNLPIAVALKDEDLKVISGPRIVHNGKVGILYIGADFCPYCAGQRWGLILTLLRFGKFKGLQYMLSSATDVHPNTPTFSFQFATYSSKFIDFQAVEIMDREYHKLMTLNKSQKKIFVDYDTPPYMPTNAGIPFVYLDGRYTLNMLMVTPKELSSKSWQHTANALADPHSQLFKNVMPKVNLMTAAICKLDGGKPVGVCVSPGVVAANVILLKFRPTVH